MFLNPKSVFLIKCCEAGKQGFYHSYWINYDLAVLPNDRDDMILAKLSYQIKMAMCSNSYGWKRNVLCSINISFLFLIDNEWFHSMTSTRQGPCATLPIPHICMWVYAIFCNPLIPAYIVCGLYVSVCRIYVGLYVGLYTSL